MSELRRSERRWNCVRPENRFCDFTSQRQGVYFFWEAQLHYLLGFAMCMWKVRQMHANGKTRALEIGTWELTMLLNLDTRRQTNLDMDEKNQQFTKKVITSFETIDPISPLSLKSIQFSLYSFAHPYTLRANKQFFREIISSPPDKKYPRIFGVAWTCARLQENEANVGHFKQPYTRRHLTRHSGILPLIIIRIVKPYVAAIDK